MKVIDLLQLPPVCRRYPRRQNPRRQNPNPTTKSQTTKSQKTISQTTKSQTTKSQKKKRHNPKLAKMYLYIRQVRKDSGFYQKKLQYELLEFHFLKFLIFKLNVKCLQMVAIFRTKLEISRSVNTNLYPARRHEKLDPTDVIRLKYDPVGLNFKSCLNLVYT